jgi:hypothetical protein
VEVKRVICASCKTTHAVMPGDMVPYKELSLFALVAVLVMVHIKKAPVLEIGKKWGFPFQSIYSALRSFRTHMNNMRQYLREASPGDMPAALDARGVLSLIREPCTGFQRGYTEANRRPCFMCKFFGRGGAPPVGIRGPKMAAT